MSGLAVMFAQGNFPEIPGMNANTPHTATHFAPAFVGLVAFCVLVIGYLIWDVLRQKHLERRERLRLKAFREGSSKPARN